MKCVLEHALSVLKPFSFVLKWKRAVSVLSPLSLFSRGGSQILSKYAADVCEFHSHPQVFVHLVHQENSTFWFLRENVSYI